MNSNDVQLAKQYIITMNGNRAGYQVPVALQEVGALRRFITDFYTPDWLMSRAANRYPSLRQRHHADLPSRMTNSAPAVCAYQAVVRGLKLAPDHHWRHIDAMLSRHTLAIARSNTDTGLISYQNYAIKSFPVINNKPKIIFQYHPHPSLMYEIFRSDFEKYPEVVWSYENERDARPDDLYTKEGLTEWSLADAIVCTSGIIKKSLEHVGCTKLLKVVPYGILRGFEVDDLPKRKEAERCRFLFVGHGVQRKGLHHLLRAWKEARLERSTLDIVSSWMDPGIAALLPLPDVNVIGRLSEADLAAKFGAAHVFAMPSLVEGFGRVYLEALSAGCFCLGTTNTGLPDLGLDHSQVSYVEVGDIEALTEQLRSAETRWARGDIDAAGIVASTRRLTLDDYRRRVREVIAEIEQAVL